MYRQSYKSLRLVAHAQYLLECTKMKMHVFLVILVALARVSVQGFDLFGSSRSLVNNFEDARNYIETQKDKVIEEWSSYMEDIKLSSSWTNFLEDKENPSLEDPDVVLSVPAMITRRGYRCETHSLISQGYVLNIHRIPQARSGGDTPSNTVILQHGLFASSADWVLNGPGKSLAFVLADAGYDVWMPNIRGNRYSREHTTLKSSSTQYWNFSWHEVAQHDIPAIIDYIRERKGSDTKIAYMGHSMGSTMLFAMLALRPEYNAVLRAGLALGPVVYLSHIKSPVKTLAPVVANAARMNVIKNGEFVPKQSGFGQMMSACSSDDVDTYVCKNAIFFICGTDEKQFNKTLLPVFLSHLGTGTSMKTILHFAQEIDAAGRFQQFDYGPTNNMKIYNSETPPEYDLRKITLPIYLLYSRNDLLSSEQDVDKLYQDLETRTEIYLVPDPEFNHVDYLMANDAPRLLNDKVLQFLLAAFADHQGPDRHMGTRESVRQYKASRKVLNT
ncbi:lipase 3-like [Bombyx mandarina]|nr:lipase 3-like [Bombyx mandarina]